jgi:putative tricarboxylic transport membrane protein
MVKQAKTKPRALSVGSAGTADDMAIAVFQAATNTQLNIIRFNSGGEALTALLGGHVDMAAGNPLEFITHLQSGNVRGLGVFRPTRFDALPAIATMKEQGIDVRPFQMWRGVAMPKGVPTEAVSYWANVMKKATETKAFRDYIKNNVAQEYILSTTDFQKFLETQEGLYRDMLASLAKK